MTVQAKVKPGARPDPGSVWASPQRDLAHSFPEYVRKALVLSQAEYTEEDTEGLAHLTEVARTVSEFISGSVGEGSCKTVGELAKQVELLSLNQAATDIFSRNLFHVVISAYWKGVRMAYAKDETPIGAAELAATVDSLIKAGSPGHAYMIVDGAEVIPRIGGRLWHLLRVSLTHLGEVPGGHVVKSCGGLPGCALIATSRDGAKAEVCNIIDSVFDEYEHRIANKPSG